VIEINELAWDAVHALSQRPVLTTLSPNHQPDAQGANAMTDKHVEDGKGRIKEAAGSLTGNQRLKNEGRADQARAKIKDALDNVVDKVTGHNKK
jgi:uncharacterized protein YjbJ (UPF0337 family)